ncbi:hypothetical protein Tco_0768619 [Tanacetum coccineum]
MENSKRGNIPMQEKPNLINSKDRQRRYQIPIGICFVLNGGTIDWKSAKKRTIVMYSIEAEHIAASKAAMEVFGTKHCQRKYHYIREVMKMGEIVINKVHTDDTVADPFTKPMSLTKHNQHAMGIGLRPASSLMSDLCF